MLTTYLKKKRREKDILLMTHIVLGYPSFEDCYRIITEMVQAGVDLMELQIPFSEPMADGPVILRANQLALERGVTIEACLDFSRRVTRDFHIPFLVMTYCNIPFAYGLPDFVRSMAERNLQGAIIPDLPPEEGEAYLAAMRAHNLAPIAMFSPTTPLERMTYLARSAGGFIYCVARKGVTGRQTRFSETFSDYLSRCRRATTLPLALGFGIKGKADMDVLKGKVDIAVIGTRTLRLVEEEGIGSIGPFIRHLR